MEQEGEKSGNLVYPQNKKVIYGIIKAIETKVETPEASGIGKWLNMMKGIDEPCYDSLMNKYKVALSNMR